MFQLFLTSISDNLDERTYPSDYESDKTISVKGHSQLYDCDDLDTSFSHFEKTLPQPEIKVHLEIRFIFCSGFLDFQSFTENLFLSVFLLIVRYYFYHIWLKAVFNSSLLYAN